MKNRLLFITSLIFLSAPLVCWAAESGQSYELKLSNYEFNRQCFADEISSISGGYRTFSVRLPTSSEFVFTKLFEMTSYGRYPVGEGRSKVDKETASSLKLGIELPKVARLTKYQAEFYPTDKSQESSLTLFLQAYPEPIFKELSTYMNQEPIYAIGADPLEKNTLEEIFADAKAKVQFFDAVPSLSPENRERLIVVFARDELSSRIASLERFPKAIIILPKESSRTNISSFPIVEFKERSNGAKHARVPYEVFNGIEGSVCRQVILSRVIKQMFSKGESI